MEPPTATVSQRAGLLVGRRAPIRPASTTLVPACDRGQIGQELGTQGLGRLPGRPMVEQAPPVPSTVQGESDATCLLLGGDNGHFTQHSFPGEPAHPCTCTATTLIRCEPSPAGGAHAQGCCQRARRRV